MNVLGSSSSLSPAARVRRERAARPAGARRTYFLLALGLCLLQSAACATRGVETRPAPRPAGEAALRVLNRTASDVRVEADGESLGEVAAGVEQLFAALAPGTFDVRGFSLDGGLVFRRDLLTLEAGETFTWILREGTPGAGAPADAAARESATVVVENATQWDVEIVLDGQVLGTASAGATGRFGGVAPGSHRLEARAPEASFPLEFPVLEPGETFTWRLRAPGALVAGALLPAPGTGRLRVENLHTEAVTVSVNGTPLGVVEANNVRIFDNLASSRLLLSAESRDGRTRFAGPATRIEPGRVTTWRVGTGGASEIALRPVPPLPSPEAGAAPTRDRIPEPAPRPLPAPAGDPSPPPPDLGAASEKVFTVENHTSQDLEIRFDGRSAGAVGAGMTSHFTDLPGLRFTPSAVSASGKQTFEHPPVDLSGRRSYTWMIQP
jgi:hypothetical protein